MAFKRTTAINRILAMKARKKVIQGGTSAGKTYAIIPILIDKAAKTPNIKITVVCESIPAVKDGPLDIFKTVMRETNRWFESGWIGSPMQYTFKNGSRIQFKSFDTFGKAKASGKRDILFINEANHISYEIADALIIRSREVFIDFNPNSEFWAHTEVLKEPNSEFLNLTFEDNEAIPPETLEDLFIKKAKAFINPELPDHELIKEENVKNNYWANWWKVYGMGLAGRLEGCIFENWTNGEFDEALPFMFGCDWGFAKDPSTLIKVAVDSKKKLLYVEQKLYAHGMKTDQFIENFKEICGKSVIIADNSELRLINEIRREGINIYPVVKPSILSGIKKIQNYEIVVCGNSPQVEEELKNYVWIDKATKSVPIDDHNHMFGDPVRYVLTRLIR
jgi:phage terminase large subunit